jgi:hypothetical protein
MKTFYRLIVIPPAASRVDNIRISRRTVLILVAALALSFLATIALMLLFPRIQKSDTDRSRLAAENQRLKIENKNARFRMEQLNEQIAHVEELSNGITALIGED